MSADLLFDLADGVALITLNRPQAMNAFEGAMREDLLARLQEVATDRAVRCVVITGVGNAFCTGGNIAGMAELQANDDVATIEQRMRTGGEVVRLAQMRTAWEEWNASMPPIAPDATVSNVYGLKDMPQR